VHNGLRTPGVRQRLKGFRKADKARKRREADTRNAHTPKELRRRNRKH
jgi:hypothetical protein